MEFSTLTAKQYLTIILVKNKFFDEFKKDQQILVEG
jgi:hypothetical protein